MWNYSSLSCLLFLSMCVRYTLFPRCSICATASRFSLQGKPAAVGLCCQFSSSVEPCIASMAIRQLDSRASIYSADSWLLRAPGHILAVICWRRWR